ncbi:hypothetical protein BH09PLA1_BH09PLA1_11200 [soil metagenome]
MMGNEPESKVTSPALPAIAARHSIPRSHTLRSIPESAQQLIHKLSEAHVLIGRGTEAALKLDSELVSRRHAVLTRKHDEYLLSDMNSSHGVYVNGLRVHSVILRDGDVIQLGDVVLTYSEA